MPGEKQHVNIGPSGNWERDKEIKVPPDEVTV